MSNIGDKLISEYVKTHDWKGEERRKNTPRRSMEDIMAALNDDGKKTNGWNEWSHAVLRDITDTKKNIDEIYNKINAINTDLTVLKTKQSSSSTIWGSLFGLLIAIIVGLLTAFINHITTVKP